ncbi:hypothetical protein HWV62_13227 [Athelia sp. TMB]|nr:hypothetical protein HWV62_13227 [Athelia sp. TMB]
MCKYEMLVDLEARHKRRKPKFVTETFYGQLQRLFTIFPGEHHPNDAVDNIEKTTIIIASIRNFVIDQDYPAPGKLDIHYSSREGALHYIDVTSIQSLVARVRDRDTPRRWAIFDRSGSLARALYQEEEDMDILAADE